MTRISVGDASLTNILARQGAELRSQVQRASQEVATGRHSDLGAALRGDYSPLLAIDASLARLSAYSSNTADAGFQTAAQQSAISGISDLASGIATTLLGAKTTSTPAQIETLGADASGRLASAIGLLPPIAILTYFSSALLQAATGDRAAIVRQALTVSISAALCVFLPIGIRRRLRKRKAQKLRAARAARRRLSRL